METDNGTPSDSQLNAALEGPPESLEAADKKSPSGKPRRYFARDIEIEPWMAEFFDAAPAILANPKNFEQRPVDSNSVSKSTKWDSLDDFYKKNYPGYYALLHQPGPFVRTKEPRSPEFIAWHRDVAIPPAGSTEEELEEFRKLYYPGFAKVKYADTIPDWRHLHGRADLDEFYKKNFPGYYEWIHRRFCAADVESCSGVPSSALHLNRRDQPAQLPVAGDYSVSSQQKQFSRSGSDGDSENAFAILNEIDAADEPPLQSLPPNIKFVGDEVVFATSCATSTADNPPSGMSLSFLC